MKRVFIIIVFSTILFSCKEESPKVLLYVRDHASQLEYMLANELGIMSDILKLAGYNVKIATFSGEVHKTNSLTLTPDLKLKDVNIDDYAGLMIPCMSSSTDTIKPEEIDLVKKIVQKQKPIAAQLSAVRILAQAGVLEGKKYAYAEEENWNAGMYPEFNSGIFSGTSVVQDGLIITSGSCPWMARRAEHQDCTTKLTLSMINLLKSTAK